VSHLAAILCMRASTVKARRFEEMVAKIKARPPRMPPSQLVARAQPQLQQLRIVTWRSTTGRSDVAEAFADRANKRKKTSSTAIVGEEEEDDDEEEKEDEKEEEKEEDDDEEEEVEVTSARLGRETRAALEGELKETFEAEKMTKRHLREVVARRVGLATLTSVHKKAVDAALQKFLADEDENSAAGREDSDLLMQILQEDEDTTEIMEVQEEEEEDDDDEALPDEQKRYAAQLRADLGPRHPFRLVYSPGNGRPNSIGARPAHGHRDVVTRCLVQGCATCVKTNFKRHSRSLRHLALVDAQFGAQTSTH